MTAAVAQFAEILRGNEWAKGAKMRDVLNVMYNVRNQLPFDNDVNEFTRTRRAGDPPRRLTHEARTIRHERNVPLLYTAGRSV